MIPRSDTSALGLLLIAIVWALVGDGCRVLAADRPSGPLHKTRSAVMARGGVAATSQPLATAGAVRGLPGGGNAGGAALAANAGVGGVGPVSGGLGGGPFAVGWGAES